MSEADIIARYFRPLSPERADVRLGIGDDAAIVAPPAGMELVLTTDALVEGTHFLPEAPPQSLGHRALAINLSDCAAMGATPAWALLSLVMPRVEEHWLAGFAAGFGALLRAHGVALVGGNLAQGPLSITVQLAGLVAQGRAVRRDKARPGDVLLVTGTLGDAAAGLGVVRGRLAGPDGPALRARFEYPTARVALGQALGGVASAGIDVSDGLHADLARLLAASNCGCELDVERLPVSPALRGLAGSGAWRYALQGGEDFELLVAAPPERVAGLREAALRCGTPLTEIATLTARAPVGEALRLWRQGNLITAPAADFDHFPA